MLEKQYFIILIKDNYLLEACEIDEERYNYFGYTFKYVYHTKNGDTYQLDKDFERGIDTLIVDGEHFFELLDDMKEQGFYDSDVDDDLDKAVEEIIKKVEELEKDDE